MDQNTKKLKGEIKRIFMELTKFYNDTGETQQDTYLTGKKEAFEDVLNWLITNHNNEYRYVNTNAFFNMIQEKINKTKSTITSSSIESLEDGNFKPINFSNIKIQESRKRVNKYLNDSNAELNDYLMDPEEKLQASPFKFNSQIENNTIFQNNNFSFSNNITNESNLSSNCLNSPNIFFPLKKEKK